MLKDLSADTPAAISRGLHFAAVFSALPHESPPSKGCMRAFRCSLLLSKAFLPLCTTSNSVKLCGDDWHVIRGHLCTRKNAHACSLLEFSLAVCLFGKWFYVALILQQWERRRPDRSSQLRIMHL